MDNVAACYVVVLSILIGLPPFWLLFKLYRHVSHSENVPLGRYQPKISVIIPCKGTDLTFEKNIQSILDQDYTDYEVIFVTATGDDQAVPILQKLMRESSKQTSLHTAGIMPGRGQKMTNMLHGVSQARKDSEAFVFLDGDVFVHRQFLRYMIHSLDQSHVGTTCGYHLFVPTKGNFGALLRLEWGVGGMLTLADPKRNFSIGAATAIKKSTFEKAGIANRLSHSITDTFCFTNGVRSLGLQVYFEPKCLFISYDKSSFRETLDWSNRLTIISRHYARSLWRLSALSFSTSSFFVAGGIAAYLVTGQIKYGILSGSLKALQLTHSALTLMLIGKMTYMYYPDQGQLILKKRLLLILLAPFTPFLICYNLLHSLIRREFIWRNIHYRINAGPKVIVLSTGEKNE